MPARTVVRVEFQPDHPEAVVVFSGDGELTGLVKRLIRDRLILDLPRVTSALPFQVFPVHHPVLKQIRIGDHAEKLRVVFDLGSPVTYSMKPEGTRLAIRLIPAVQSLTGPRGGERPAAFSPIALSLGGPTDTSALPMGSAAFAQMAPDGKSTSDSAAVGQPRYVGRRISLDLQNAVITHVLQLTP